MFLSLTQGMSRSERLGVAFRATLIAFCILTFFALGGRNLLDWLGIGLPAFRIAGGLLLFWIAFEMVFELRTDRKQHTADVAVTADHIRHIAAFPLAIPLMAGPGAITAVLLLSARAGALALGLAGRMAVSSRKPNAGSTDQRTPCRSLQNSQTLCEQQKAQGYHPQTRNRQEAEHSASDEQDPRRDMDPARRGLPQPRIALPIRGGNLSLMARGRIGD